LNSFASNATGKSKELNDSHAKFVKTQNLSTAVIV